LPAPHTAHASSSAWHKMRTHLARFTWRTTHIYTPLPARWRALLCRASFLYAHVFAAQYTHCCTPARGHLLIYVTYHLLLRHCYLLLARCGSHLWRCGASSPLCWHSWLGAQRAGRLARVAQSKRCGSTRQGRSVNAGTASLNAWRDSDMVT